MSLKTVLKSILRLPLTSVLLGFVIWAYMALCARTIRWRVEGGEEARQVWAMSEGVILAAWHSMILNLPAGWIKYIRQWPGRTAPVAMLVSFSPEGEAAARAIRHFGLQTIRGSRTNKRKKKSKQGGMALREAIALLKSGGAVCMTPDGPRGPARICGKGPVVMAERTGAAILPYALATHPAKTLSSWDRLQIPFPFTRGAIVFGAPVYPQDFISIHAMREALQTSLIRATDRALTLSGQTPGQASGQASVAVTQPDAKQSSVSAVSEEEK